MLTRQSFQPSLPVCRCPYPVIWNRHIARRSESHFDVVLPALHLVAHLKARHKELQEPRLVRPRLPGCRVTPFTDRQEVVGVRLIGDQPGSLETLLSLPCPFQKRRPAIHEHFLLAVLEVPVRRAEACTHESLLVVVQPLVLRGT